MIPSRKSIRDKRRIHNRARRAMEELTGALQDMQQFAKDHRELYQNSNADTRRIEFLEYGADDSVTLEHVAALIHAFNCLSED